MICLFMASRLSKRSSEFFVSQEAAAEKIARFVEHYNYARPHSSLAGFTPADRYFGVVDGVKRYLADMTSPKNVAEENADLYVSA